MYHKLYVLHSVTVVICWTVYVFHVYIQLLYLFHIYLCIYMRVLSIYLYVYIYIYIYMYMCVYVLYVYMLIHYDPRTVGSPSDHFGRPSVVF